MQLFKLPRLHLPGHVRRCIRTLPTPSAAAADVLSLFLLFAPVAFVTLAEHIADHKNLSSIIDHDLHHRSRP